MKGKFFSIFPVLAMISIAVVEVTAQAPSFNYNVEYVCNKDNSTERVVVRYCRRDSDKPGWPATTDDANYCHVEYLDRPTNVPNIAMFKSELHSDIAAKLSTCKDPVTGKSPGRGASTTAGMSADTSIAKALAAKVDLNILGMRFGEPLRLGDCPFLLPGPMKQNCFPAFSDLVSALAKELETGEKAADDVKNVKLTASNCPSWVQDCTAYVTVHNGVLDGVSLFTNGRNAMNAVTKDLTAKYGKPTSIAPKTFKPDVGNAFNYNQPSWVLPGLRVTYDVVFNVQDETDTERASSKVGMVRIMTEAEHQRRLNKQKEPVKSKL